MKLRKILTILMIAAACSSAAFAVTVNAAEEDYPSIAVVMYGTDEAGNITSCTLTENMTIDGAVHIDYPLSLNGYNMIINGDVRMSKGITVGNGTLTINGNLIQNGGAVSFAEGGKLYVTGNFEQHSAVSVDKGEMTVGGEYYHTDGRLTIGSGKLTVDGDYNNRYKNSVNEDGTINYTGTYGVINMTDDDGYFLVNGNFYMGSVYNDSSNNNYITAGTLELKGNFEQVSQNSYNFNAKENHKVILSGEGKQTIKFNSPGYSGFNILTDTNNPKAEVCGRISKLGSNVTIGSFEQSQTLNLGEYTMTVKNDVVAHGTINGDTGVLNIGGNYCHDSGKLNVQAGRITVDGDTRFQYLNTPNEDGTPNYTGSNAVLQMTDDKGYYLSKGNFYMGSVYNYSSNNNYITAGTLELKGNFEQVSQNSNNFNAQGTHKVILSGEGKQTIKFNSPDYSGFNILTDTNNPKAEVCGRITKLGNNVTIGSFEQSQTLNLGEYTLTVKNDVVAHGTINGDTGVLNIGGNYRHDSGKLNVQAGRINVDGDTRFQYLNSTDNDGTINYTGSKAVLQMTDEKGYYLSKGNFYMGSVYNDSSNNNYITAGTLELKGNFEQVSQNSNNFNAQGTHKVILSGEGKQTIKFNSPGYSGFNILTDTNNPKAEVCGRITKLGNNVTIGSFEQSQTLNLGEYTLTVKNDVVAHGTINGDTGVLNIGGNYRHDSGKLNVQAGRITVNGDTRFQYLNSTDDDGTPNYTGSKAVLQMTDDKGYYLSKGNFYMGSVYNDSSNNNYITAGTLELKGDFEQLGNNSSNFNARGTHKVIFSGSDVQNITFTYPEYSGFNILSYTPNYKTNVKARITKISKNVAVGNFEQYGELNLKGNSLKVRNELIANGTIYGNGGLLNVIGNYTHQSGKLKIQDGIVKVGGDLRFQYRKTVDDDGNVTEYSGSAAILNMANDKGYLLVNGDMIMDSIYNDSSTNSYIVAGTIELKGNFEQLGNNSNNFNARGTNKLILSGIGKQILKFTTPNNSGFNILASVTNPDTHIIGRIASLGNDVTVGSFEQYQTLDLNGKTMNVSGKMYAHGTVNLNAGTLNTSSYIQNSGKLNVQDGRLNTRGDFRFLHENSVNEDGSINYSGSNAVINMTDDNGYILVNGDMYIGSTCNDSSTNNYITAGTLELKGNFEQLSYNSNNFIAKGTHKLILSGDKKQVIKFSNPNNSGFNILASVTNPDTHIIGRIASLGNDVTIGSFEPYQTFDLNGKKLTVTQKMYSHGNVILNGGTIKAAQYIQNNGKLEIGSGKLLVDGDFRLQHENSVDEDGTINYTGATAWLNMTDQRGYILTNGNFYIFSTYNNSSTNNYMTAGTIEIKGNFYQGENSSCHAPSGTHKTVFSGTDEQTASFSSKYSYFNILDISRNPKAASIALCGHKVLISEPELVNLSAISKSQCTLGDTVALIGVAAGGKGEYHYTFFYKKHTSEQWSVLGAKNGTVCVAALTPGKAVDYDIMIAVYDDEGSVESDVFTLHVLPKALENNSTVSTDSVVVNQSVTITGEADGGYGNYTYTYQYKKSKNTDWVTIKDSNISGNKATFKPTAATDYDVKVTVTDSNGNSKEKTFTLKYSAALVNNATISTETVTVGNKVVLKGAASGGAGSYTYSFYYKKSKNSAWTAISENTAKSAAFKPGSAVSYDAKVVVTDADGKTAEKIFTVNVTK